MLFLFYFVTLIPNDNATLTLLDGFLHVGIKTDLSSSKAHSGNFRIRMINAIY